MALPSTFSAAKFEALFLKSSSSSSSQFPSRALLPTAFLDHNRKTFVRRGVVRCGAQPSDASVGPNNAISLSALELLKTSAADSKSG